MPNSLPQSNGSAYTNVQRLNDELLIAQRGDQRKATWYLLKLGTEWVRRSLQTTDLKAARARAYEAFRVWQDDPTADWLAATGTTKHHVSFKSVADEWLATQTTDYKYKAAVVRKFLLPFFHELRLVTDISNVNDNLIADYRLWRLKFWQGDEAGQSGDVPASIETSAKQAAHYQAPRATTLNRENPTLRQILKYAGKKGYFGARPVPEVAMEASKPNPRPAFLGGDFDKLAKTAAVWIAEAETDLVRWRRQLLADWIWVARHTGIRLPHEADALTWGDVRLDTRLLHIPEDTKTGKRDVPLNDMALARLKDMRARRIAHAKNSNQKFRETEPLFLMVDGSSPGDLGKLFNQLIEKCQFPARSDGDVYSPYSLRHTFATFALAEGMTSDRIAEAMGTSVKMLLSHYKHGTIEETRRYVEKQAIRLPAISAHRERPFLLGNTEDQILSIGDSTRLALSSDGKRVVLKLG